MKTWIVPLILVLGLPVLAWGQAVRTLSWGYTRATMPSDVAFLLLAIDSSGTVARYQVAPSAAGACPPHPQESVADTFCTTLPCPPPLALVTYWVQAVSGPRLSVPSNLVTCWSPPAAPCLCDPPGLVPPPGLPPLPPLVPAPPPLIATPPPLPQRDASGLDLQPVGLLPALALLPAIPASGGL